MIRYSFDVVHASDCTSNSDSVYRVERTRNGAEGHDGKESKDQLDAIGQGECDGLHVGQRALLSRLERRTRADRR